MELQNNLDTMKKNGIQPYAISYDSVDILHAFAEKHGITYPLLSDADSTVIGAYNLFNHLVPRDHAWYGVPFPGSYMVNAQGIVTDKSFYANHGVRSSVASMLQESFHITPSGRPVQTVETEDLTATAALSSGTIRRGQVQTFTLDIALKNGRHIYSPTVTGGYIPTQLTFQPVEEVWFSEVSYPKANTVTILNEEVAVYSDHLTLKATVRNRRRADFTVRASLKYQACDENECYMPQEVIVELPLRYLENV